MYPTGYPPLSPHPCTPPHRVMGVLHEHLLNKYFENPEQTEKVPKS